MKRKQASGGILFLVLIACLGFFIRREQFILLAGCMIGLFGLYYMLCYSRHTVDLGLGLTVAIAARVILLFAFPTLSDDVYRFLWDGLLATDGHSPYAFLPSSIDFTGESSPQLEAIFSQLNSPEYYSIYPPVSQVIFAICTAISGGDIAIFVPVLKILFLLAELGIFYFLVKVLILFNLPPKKVLFYALNPLVIVEGVGNLHFEVFLVFFVVGAIYFLLNNKGFLFLIFMSLSIGVKLVSLILWPFFIGIFGLRKWLLYSIGLIVVVSLLFFPLWNVSFASNYLESLDLYFRTFEFNASIYYLIRSIGYAIKGYNWIAVAGPVLSFIALTIIIYLIWSARSRVHLQHVLPYFVVALTIYLLFATTVHPWYLLLPLALSCLTSLTHIMVWSAVIWVSYAAYSVSPTSENTMLITLEYTLVGLAIYCDWIRKKNPPTPLTI